MSEQLLPSPSPSPTPTPTSPLPPIPPELSYVAKGAYGCVIKPALPNRVNNYEDWTQYPNNVTKLFFKKGNMKKAYTNSQTMYNLLGRNNGHKTQKYRHKYRSSNIPNNVRTRCKKIGRNVKLYTLRMKNLGNDFWALDKDHKYKKYRTIYVGTLLDQILKVMKQLQILVVRKIIHGDVRETNLMIHPETGIITLIDFDLLYPVDTYFDKVSLGFYCHPPETLLYKDFKYFINATSAEINTKLAKREIDSKLEKYSKHHLKFQFAKPQYLNRKAKKSQLKSALKDSIFYFTTCMDPDDSNSELQKALGNILLPSYDSYGLAFTLLEFLTFVYPSVTIRVQEERFSASLKSRISNNGIPYTDEQIIQIRTSLHSLVEVLEPMADLRVQRRMNIHTGVERMEAIVKEFHARM